MGRRALIAATLAVSVALAAAPAHARVAPAPEPLPDGDTRPAILEATLLPPGAHNALLEADLDIEATDNIAVDHFELRWTLTGAPAMKSDVQIAPAEAPVVSFADTKPRTHYTLEVRAVDNHGWMSEWETAWSGKTPGPPNVIVAGDSVASGYSRQWFTQDSTCVDEGYSYGATVAARVGAALPAAWTPTYTNIAWPGAGVGDVLNGGADSCSVGYPSQIDVIEQLADPATWNVVVVTAGINSTNWVDVITRLTRDTAFSLTDAGDKRVCQDAVATKWNLEERKGFITDVTRDIAEALETRTNARLYWTSYYQLAGTRFAPLWSPIGAECEDEMNLALERLHSAIRSGLTENVTWIDLGGRSVATQRWAGWPHPNPEGHRTIGAIVASSITVG